MNLVEAIVACDREHPYGAIFVDGAGDRWDADNLLSADGLVDEARAWPVIVGPGEIWREDERGYRLGAEPLYRVRPIRKPGRPLVHQEPRRDLYLRLPEHLVARIDALADNRTAWIEQAIRQRLERDER